MKPHSLLMVTAAAWLAACSHVAAHRSAASIEVDEDLTARTGAAAPRLAGSPAAVRAAIDELLRDGLHEDDAVRIALLANQDVRAGYERLGIAAADLVQGGLLRNPVFAADALLASGGPAELTLSLAQPFVELFWQPLRQRAAEHELDAVQASVTSELVQLTFAVRREFVRVHAAEQLVEILQRRLAAARAAHSLTRSLSLAGNVVGGQLSTARLAEGRARLELADAERRVVEAREGLNALLGLWGHDVVWHLAAPIEALGQPPIDTSDLEARAVAASLALRENQARLDAAAQGVAITTWSRWLPDVLLGASVRRDLAGQTSLGPSVAVTLPFADDGTAAAASAEGAVQMLMFRHAQLGIEVRARARLLRERHERLEAHARFVEREYLPTQDRLLRETIQDYNAMQIGAFEVLAAKLRQLDVALELVVAASDVRLARLDLAELLAGGPVHGALRTDAPTTGTRPEDGGARR